MTASLTPISAPVAGRLPRVLAAGAVAALALLGAAAASPAQAAYTYYTFDNTGAGADGNFNQLLGVNNADEVAGYDGDGTIVPNKAYLLIPRNHYSDENFPTAVQTQSVGINNEAFPTTVGFYVDSAGNNFGWVNVAGAYFVADNPKTGVSGGIKTNQLLGINSHHEAAGFYNDSHGNSHGYVYNFHTMTYTNLVLPFSGVVSFQATGINDNEVLCGFWVDKGGVSHGWFGKINGFTSYDAPGFSGVAFFGINNKNVVAATVTTAAGVSEGWVYNTGTKSGVEVMAPNQSATAAFGFSGTTLNGINDNGDLVGFYSDGKKVHGLFVKD